MHSGLLEDMDSVGRGANSRNEKNRKWVLIAFLRQLHTTLNISILLPEMPFYNTKFSNKYRQHILMQLVDPGVEQGYQVII